MSSRRSSLPGPVSTRDLSGHAPASGRGVSLAGAPSPSEADPAAFPEAASDLPEAHEPSGRRPLPSVPDSPVLQIVALIRARFQAPAILLALAIGITLFDLAAVRIRGAPFTLGPIRSPWIAGPLAILGGVLLIWRIVVDHEDDG